MAEAPEQPAESATTGPRSRWRPVVLVVTVAIAVLFVGGVAVGFHEQRYTPPTGTQIAQSLGTSTVDGVSMPHVKLYFQTYPDSSGSVKGVPIHPGGNSGWPAYAPSNEFQVPAHSLVTVDVRQYDSGGVINNPYFASVHGTVGGVATVNGKVVRAIDPNNVGHTFTMRATPGTDPGFFLSVPFPAVPGDNQSDSGKYETIQFSFVSGSKGLYAWNCEFPCGSMIAGFGGVMSAYGYMSGFVHVV